MQSARVVAAGARVGGDGGRLADLPRDQVVGVGGAVDRRHRRGRSRRCRAGAGRRRRARRAARWPRRRRPCRGRGGRGRGRGARARGTRAGPWKCSKSSFGMPRCLDLLVDRAVLVGLHLAGQQRRLAVDRQGAAGLVDVGGLAHQPGVLVDLGLAAARHDHDLDAGAVAGLERPRLGQREVALGVAEERAAPARAGSRRGRCRRSAGARSRPLRLHDAWWLSDRTLDLPRRWRGHRQRHRGLDVRGRPERNP